MKTTTRAAILGAFTAATVVSARLALADTVVQIPVDSVLDGRSVSTLNGGTVVPWTPGQGLDGDGNSDGFVTNAVEAVLFQQQLTNAIGKALPDDGVFPADARHPDIVLHFSNAAPTTSPQTHQVHIATGPQTFHFAVPQATYSKMFLLITSSEGVAALTIALTYADGTPASTQSFMLPDYGIGGAPANDPVYFNLISGMRKWNTQDREGDTTTHTITGIELTPSTTGMLADIKVTKTNGAHVVFWGATGIATSPVDAGSSAGDAEAEAQAGTDGGDDASGPNGSSGGMATDSGAASDSGASGTASGSSGGSTTPGASNSGGSSGCSLSGRAGGDFSPWMLLLVLWATTRNRSRRPSSRYGITVSVAALSLAMAAACGGSGASNGAGSLDDGGSSGSASGGNGNGASSGSGGSSSGSNGGGSSGSTGGATSSSGASMGDAGDMIPPASTGGACAAAPAATSVCTGGVTGVVTGTVGAANSCWGPGIVTLGMAGVSVPAGVTLTINPGTTISGTGAIATAGGTIKAMGAASSPVIFLQTSIKLTGGSHTFQYSIVNSAAPVAIDANGAQVSISHMQIQKYSATGLSIHGAGAKATVDFSTFGSTATLFATGANGVPVPPAVAVAIDAAASGGGTSITNSSLGFIQDNLNNGLQEAGATSSTHLAYDFIAGTANKIVTTDKTGVFNAAPGIADIPNLNHNLASFAPALDLADPQADYSQEPAPNGGRANVGYYGGTECATQTTVQIVSPDGCESFPAGSMQTITWNASPDTPAPGSKTLAFSSDNGQTWNTLATIPAGNDPNTATVALPNVMSDQCLVRISQDNDPTHIVSVSQTIFAVGKPANAAMCTVKPRCPAGTTGCKPFLALGYEGYRDGQAPGAAEPTCAQVSQDLNILQPYTKGIRTYASSPMAHDGMCVPGLADMLHLDFHMGVWVDNKYTDAQNFAAIDASVGIVCGQPSANGCPTGPSVHPSIKTFIVGNEFLLRVREMNGDSVAAEARLVSYIKYARARVPSTIEVVTAESYPDWLTASVNLYDAVDRIMWHSHPWWERIAITQAATHFASTHDKVTARMKALGITKPERCAETGWPWGVTDGAAVGSEANQGQYLHDIDAYSAQVGLEYWFFEAFDESWKTAEGPVGGKWGQFKSTRPASLTSYDDTANEHLVIMNLATEVPPTTEWP